MESGNTKIIVSVIIILALAAGVAWFVFFKKGAEVKEESESLGGQISSAVENPVSQLPETNPFQGDVNPFGADTNPASSVNPFTNPYKNPFE